MKNVNCPNCNSTEIGQVVYESGDLDDQVFCIECDFVFIPEAEAK